MSNQLDNSNNFSLDGREIFFDQILVFGKYLDDNNTQQQSFMTQFFKVKEIKSIMVENKKMLVKFIKKRSFKKKIKKEEEQSGQSPISSAPIGIKSLNTNLYNSLPILIKKLEYKESLCGQSIESEFLEYSRMKSNGQLVFHLFFQISLELPTPKYFLLSKKLLQLLDYSIEQAPLHFRDYKHLSMNAIPNALFKILFQKRQMLLVQASNLDDENFTNQKLTQICKNSTTVLKDSIIGKNNLEVKVEISAQYIKPWFLEIRYPKILSKRIPQNQYMKKAKIQADINNQNNAYQSLSSIYRFPKADNPKNSMKLCSYRTIDKNQRI